METKGHPGIHGTWAPLSLSQASEGRGRGVHFKVSGHHLQCDGHIQQCVLPVLWEIIEREQLFVGKGKIGLLGGITDKG